MRPFWGLVCAKLWVLQHHPLPPNLLNQSSLVKSLGLPNSYASLLKHLGTWHSGSPRSSALQPHPVHPTLPSLPLCALAPAAPTLWKVCFYFLSINAHLNTPSSRKPSLISFLLLTLIPPPWAPYHLLGLFHIYLSPPLLRALESSSPSPTSHWLCDLG